MKEALRNLKVSLQLMFGIMLSHLSKKGSRGWGVRDWIILPNLCAVGWVREGKRSRSDSGAVMGAINFVLTVRMGMTSQVVKLMPGAREGESV